jgi:hypothetical protein
MQHFLKISLWTLLVCVVLAALAVAAGVWIGELGQHMHVVVDGESITVDGLSGMPWHAWLAAWVGVTLAFIVVITVVPLSLLFALAVTVLALAFSAALLAIPAALMAAPFALAVWLIWRRKRAKPGGPHTSAA